MNKLIIVLILLLASVSNAQSLLQGGPIPTYTGTDKTSREPCRVPSMFIDTDALTGQRNFVCEGTTFVRQGRDSEIIYVEDYLGTTASTLTDVQAAVNAATDGQIVMMPEGLTTIDLSSDAGGATVNVSVDGTANTYTRASGSWTGVEIGDWVAWCQTACNSAPTDFDPFVNSVNSLPRRVTNVAGTVLTVDDPGNIMVTEGATAADYIAGKRGIELPARRRLVGYGGGSIDLVTPTNPGSRITFTDSAMGVGIHINGSGVQISDINISMDTPTNRHKYTSAIMCGWEGYYNEIHIDKVGIQGHTAGTGIGLYVRGCLSSSITRSQIHRMGLIDSGGAGIVLTEGSGSATQSSNAWQIKQNHLQSSDGILIEKQAYPSGGLPVSGVFIEGNTIEGGKYGIRQIGDSLTINQISLVNNWLESDDTDCVNVQIETAKAIVVSKNNRYGVGGSGCRANFRRTIASSFVASNELDTFDSDVMRGTVSVADFDLTTGANVYVYNIIGEGGYTVAGGGRAFKARPDQIYYAVDYVDGSTTAGIQEAITAACSAFPTSPYGGIVMVPTGNITISTGIYVPCNWLTLAGTGGGSRIIWSVAGLDAITVVAESNVTIRDINIDPAVADAGNRGIVARSSRLGTHTGSNNVATLTDSAVPTPFQSSNVGHTIRNITDNSSCTVSSVTNTTVTCTLTGGTDNDWDTNDSYRIEIAGPGALHIENVIATGETQTGIGFECDGCLKSTILNSHFANWNDGANLTGTTLSSFPNANSAIGSTFSSNADDGIDITELNANFGLQDVTFESNTGDGLVCDASTNGYAVVSGESLYFESNGASALHRPTGGCGFAISKSRWSDTGTAPDYWREDSSTQKEDVFYANHFSDNGMTNATGVPVPLLFSVRLNGMSTSCASSSVCRIYDGSTLAHLGLPATITGAWDFGGGSLEIPNSTTLPGTCTVGQQYMDTDATTGQRHYLCESANTWVLQGDGGGGGGAPTTAKYIVGQADAGLSAEIAPASDDQVPVSDSSTGATFRTLPDSDAATQKLQYDQSTNTFSAGTDDDVPETGDFGGMAASDVAQHDNARHTGDVIPNATQDFGANHALLDEIVAPATPAAGKVAIYAKTGSPGELCSKDDAGVETCMSAGSGSSGLTHPQAMSRVSLGF